MSKSIFLDLDNQIEKSAFVEIKNTSDKDIDLTNAIKKKRFVTEVIQSSITLNKPPTSIRAMYSMWVKLILLPSGLP